MKDKKLIITGMIIFFIIVTFPFWYNRGKAAPQPGSDTDSQSKSR